MLTAKHIREIVQHDGLQLFLNIMVDRMEHDFSRWDEFNKSERHATRVQQSVVELMPCSDQNYYSGKYVNGHPKNRL